MQIGSHHYDHLRVKRACLCKGFFFFVWKFLLSVFNDFFGSSHPTDSLNSYTANAAKLLLLFIEAQ